MPWARLLPRSLKHVFIWIFKFKNLWFFQTSFFSKQHIHSIFWKPGFKYKMSLKRARPVWMRPNCHRECLASPLTWVGSFCLFCDSKMMSILIFSIRFNYEMKFFWSKKRRFVLNFHRWNIKEKFTVSYNLKEFWVCGLV
jgi:hypothetical protein